MQAFGNGTFGTVVDEVGGPGEVKGCRGRHSHCDLSCEFV